MIELWLAFLAGLAASPHCIGMCGGVVAAMTLGRSGSTRGELLAFHLLYNAGRIITYTALGAVAGYIGTGLYLLSLKTVSLWLSLGVNVVILLLGLATFLSAGRWSLFSLEFGTGEKLMRLLQLMIGRGGVLWGLPIGMVLGFMPCGLVYGALLNAVGTASPMLGGATMAALGLGTMPALLCFGWISGLLSARLRRWLFRIAALCIALMGTVGLWRTLDRMGYLPGDGTHPPACCPSPLPGK